MFAARDLGDAEMAAVVTAWFGLLATGLANLLFAFNPSRVVVGGGITARGPAFLQELRAEMRLRPCGPSSTACATSALASRRQPGRGLLGSRRASGSRCTARAPQSSHFTASND